MRRRQAYAVAGATPLPLPPQEDRNVFRRYIDRTEKGVCPKCNRYIGKGIGPHKRYCKG